MVRPDRRERWVGRLALAECRLSIALIALAAASLPALAQVASRTRPRIPVDVRRDDPALAAAIAAQRSRPDGISRRVAAARLRKALPGVTIDFDELLDTPAFIRSHAGFLTGPADSIGWLATIRAWVAAHEDLLGIDAGLLAACRVSREIVARDTGARFVTLQQTVGGLDLIGAELRAALTSRGEIVAIASTLVPLPRTPPATASVFSAYLALSREAIRPVTIMRVQGTAADDVVEETRDAIDGRLLVSRDVVLHATSATYNVLARGAPEFAPFDSPTPASPGFCTPSSVQPPVSSRALRTLAALDARASPSGWIDPNDTTTSGNNVAAHLPGVGPIEGSSPRFFDFPLDLALAPSISASASVTQLFYDVNWIHDRLYQLGFDEASGNYQRMNFGRGGLEGDAIDAVAQDTGSNNAFFIEAPDGTPGGLHLFNFTFPAPDRDGALDAEVVIHEAVHGLSTRLVGDLAARQSDGIGEGWSDFYSLALLSEPSDDPRACYAEAAYVAYQLFGLTENYTFGIRRFPYSTDRAKNPLTFADIDPAQIAFDPSIPKSPLIGTVIATAADDSHNVGEVFASALWSARARLIDVMGFAGNERMMRLVTDGMKLTPANPTFTQARDAILAADQVDFGGADLAQLWAGFAERGLGLSAIAPPASTTAGVVEAFDLPSGLGGATASAIPALSEWGMILLAALLAGCGVLALRR